MNILSYLLMNTDILILSIIQGIGEILPISSSINLCYFSSLFHLQDISFSFKIALHAGSLITLLLFFKKEIAQIFQGIFSKKTKLKDTYFKALLFGSVPIFAVGFFAKDFVREFDSKMFHGISNCIFGFLLFIIDSLAKNTTSMTRTPVSSFKAFCIGLAQTIAIFPGVSRLGICITASRVLGVDRKKSIYFSLLLAIPSIAGAIVLELFETITKKPQSAEQLFSAATFTAITSTAIVELIFIKFLIKYMIKHSFFAIAIYRLIIGLLICFSSLT